MDNKMLMLTATNMGMRLGLRIIAPLSYGFWRLGRYKELLIARVVRLARNPRASRLLGASVE